MAVIKRELDFMIIGAQKSGTTSLFKYLEGHPQIYMPPEKEAPFFCYEERLTRGWEWYLREFFGEAPADRLWGKATPDYMADPLVPERIKCTLPHVRLIAILRNPVERAYSEYLMNRRRGLEQRDFAQAVAELLQPVTLTKARCRPIPTDTYIVRGEYGRILSAYYSLFARSQLEVLYLDDLRQDPQRQMDRVYRFLGIDTAFVPANLGVRYHEGAMSPRWPWADKLRESVFMRSLWRKLPAKSRRRFLYWFDQRNVVVTDNGAEGIAPVVRVQMVRHYAGDIELLSDLTGARPPWPEWK